MISRIKVPKTINVVRKNLLVTMYRRSPDLITVDARVAHLVAMRMKVTKNAADQTLEAMALQEALREVARGLLADLAREALALLTTGMLTLRLSPRSTSPI